MAPTVSLREATRTWLRIGLSSFGGPAAQIAVMHRVLVEEKRWISEERFLHALNFCMILPGPEAQQLATYVGWMLHRVRGGLIAGLLFIAPGFLVILGLSYLYAAAGTVPLVQGLFLGLKAAVIAIVLQAVLRIGRRSLRSVHSKWIAALAFLAMYGFDVAFPIVILAAAALGWIHAQRQLALPVVSGPQFEPRTRHHWRVVASFAALWLLPVLALNVLLGRQHVFAQIATFFSQMAVITFGGAYAVLAYVAQEAVQVRAWLSPGEMIDGLAMAETTPGPLILVLQFVGFMAAYRSPGSLPPPLAALFGAVLTTWVTFTPCFLWIFLGAPYVERLRGNRHVQFALSAVSAAVVGVVVNLALWFGIHTLFAHSAELRWAFLSLSVPVLGSVSIPMCAMTLIAVLLTFRWRLSLTYILAVTGALGMLLRLVQR